MVRMSMARLGSDNHTVITSEGLLRASSFKGIFKN
jgi:hypothetical protein